MKAILLLLTLISLCGCGEVGYEMPYIISQTEEDPKPSEVR